MIQIKSLILAVFILLINSQVIFGQTEMTAWKYQLDLDELESDQYYIPEQKNTTFLKLVNAERDENYYYSFGNTLRGSILKNKLSIYSEASSATSLSEKEAYSRLNVSLMDTIYSFDSDTYEETVEVVKSEKPTFPNLNTVYQIDQKWSFNAKKQELNNVIKGITVINGFEEKENEELLFYIKNNAKIKSINTAKLLKKKRIVWAKSITYYGTFENEELKNYIMSKKHINSHQILSTIDNELMTPAEINEIIAGSVDTLLDYKKDDIEPQISIVRKEALTGKNVKDFKIIQDFYYDKKKNVLLTKIVAIAPSLKRYDEAGNYLYTLPLFWIRYD